LFGILAELGLIGGALWILLLVVTLFNARRSWTKSKETGNRSLEVLSQAVFYSILIYAMYSPFSVVHTDKLLWMLLGFSEVLRRLALSQKETIVDNSREALATADTSREPRSWQT
jgi:O-antigen ligase